MNFYPFLLNSTPWAEGESLMIIGKLTFLFLYATITGLGAEQSRKDEETDLYSKPGVERAIKDFFKGKKGGFFLDVGSGHYKTTNSTYYLEKHLGWRGIAVDALAEYALGYILNRPNTRFYSFLVTDHSWTFEPFYRVDVHTGLSSSDRENQEIKAYDPHEEKVIHTIYLPTITLTDLLEKNGVSHIDFLSIDIQGGEEKALAGFDIDRLKPRLVRTENTSKPIVDYFLSHRYYPIPEYDRHSGSRFFAREK